MAIASCTKPISAFPKPERMANLLQYVVDAASLAGLYALAALGIGLLFGIMRLINFAFGDYIAWGAYALVVPSSSQVAEKLIGAWPPALMIAAIIAFVMALALVSERMLFRPLRNAAPETLLIASFAASYLLQNLVLLVHSGRPKSVNIGASLAQSVSVSGLRFSLLDIVAIGASAAILLGLGVLLRTTRLGTEMRAAAENFEMARLLGVNADRVIAVAFAASGGVAGVIALIVVAKSGVLDYHMGVPLALVGFISTVIGGMGSLSGALLGGVVLGIVSVALQAALPESLRPARDAFVFALVMVLLVARPQGLVRVRAARERI
jgi:branched-chain amino acid transport system permease protein